MNSIITSKRASAADLCITFEVNGETYSICIGEQALDQRSKDEVLQVLGDVLSCTLCCRKKKGFGLCMARCVEGDGKCCDSGATNCE